MTGPSAYSVSTCTRTATTNEGEEGLTVTFVDDNGNPATSYTENGGDGGRSWSPMCRFITIQPRGPEDAVEAGCPVKASAHRYDEGTLGSD